MPITVSSPDQLRCRVPLTRSAQQVQRDAQGTLVFSAFAKGTEYAEIFGNADKEHPMSCGLYTKNEGSDPVTAEQPSDVFSWIIEGTYSLGISYSSNS